MWAVQNFRTNSALFAGCVLVLAAGLFSPGALPEAAKGGEGPPRHVTFPSGESLPVTAGPTAAGEEHYDPHATNNPLLDVSGANAGKKLSKNFTAAEFAHSGSKKFAKARIDPKLVESLQKLRDHLGRPVTINSGYRSYLYNKELYEKKGQKPTQSRHLSGQAADVQVPGLSGLEIARAAIEACGPEIAVGIGADYAHLDVRGKWARWTYFTGDKDRQVLGEIDAYRQQRRKP